jgi:hypothetical protein
MASLHSPPLYSSKRVMRLRTLPFTTVEDDPISRQSSKCRRNSSYRSKRVRPTTKMSTPTSSLADRSRSSVPLRTDQPLDHSIRRTNSDCGMVSPSAVAVFRLMTDSEVAIIFQDGRGAAQRPRQSLSA